MRSIRYVFARTVIHIGLKMLPPGRVKDDLYKILTEYWVYVQGVVAGREKLRDLELK